MPQYKTYIRVQIDGGSTPAYINAVSACLDTIAGTADGKKLLDKICSLANDITIKHTDSGNSCSRGSDEACPPLTRAIRDKNTVLFPLELMAAIDKAKRSGIPIEHFARQLSMGLTPVTYQAKANVVRPTSKPSTPSSQPQNQMFGQALATGNTIQVIKDLMAGSWSVIKLPRDWEFHLPRLLRNYLTPGHGAASTVNFNSTKTFHCVDDPAMHQRPPAIGLAHELIHALHNSQGVNMGLVSKSGEKLEELVTTGLPPYHFEELSDNKMRTQWPNYMDLRLHY